MTKPKHTPGPWNVAILSVPGFQRAYQLNATTQERRPVDVDLANAQLIAAAPELLEALIHAHAYIQLSMPQYSAELMKRIESAINKAQAPG